MKMILFVMVIVLVGHAPHMCTAEKLSDGLQLTIGDNQLRVQVVTPAIFHIIIAPKGLFSNRPSLAVIKAPETVPWRMTEETGYSTISTSQGKASIDRRNGAILFKNAAGNLVLDADDMDTLSVQPNDTDGERTYRLRQNFHFSSGEGIYGLGQFEDGLFNLRGQQIVLTQANRVAINPFLVTSNGCGILWDNYSVSYFQDGADGCSLSSECGDQIDYYVVLGNSIDQAIAGYRLLTGAAPLFPKWAFGYFQSKERYKSADEVIGIVKEYRNRRIPLDVIVQDWAYWGGQENFSGMVWNAAQYPNPKAFADAIHDLHARLMVSIWPAFGPASEIYQEMLAKGLLYSMPHWSGGRVYDAYSPGARQIYWNYVKSSMQDNGIDAYWMDGTEPEFRCTDDRYITAASIQDCGRNAMGSMKRYTNPYSLLTTQGVYEGHRASGCNKRVFILTRSAFAGQQRYAAATWSGDTFAGWEVFRNQITAGLTFCMSGIPYWTADIGGFLTQPLFPQGVDDPAFQELYVRWFQFGVFCPIFRAHGTNTPREIWRFGEPGSWGYDALVKSDRLRYRLLPYIYSLAWQVTHDGYTMMRALPMDFPDDPVVLDLGKQFMFGPALLVCPVTHPALYPPPLTGESIPSRFLFDASGKEPGLELEFFDDLELKASCLRRKLDQSSIGWFGCLPLELDSVYSVRCRGQVFVDAIGDYTFCVTTNGSVRFWLGDTVLIDAWDNRQQNTFSAHIRLEEKEKYALKIEHQQFQPRQANLRLTWIKPAHQQQDDKRIYLPQAKCWYDFWTGEVFPGGERQPFLSTIDHLPLFVPAGTILPIGPDLQYSDEKPADPLEIRIYPGKDAEFVLYEDENDGYGYERSQYMTIKLQWKEKKKRLIIGERNGSFPGMLEKRAFHIVLVGKGCGVGLEVSEHPDQMIQYDGREIDIYRLGE